MRKPVAAVVAEVVSAAIEATPFTSREPEPAPEAAEGEQAADVAEKVDDEPKRRGWWSRAISGS